MTENRTIKPGTYDIDLDDYDDDDVQSVSVNTSVVPKPPPRICVQIVVVRKPPPRDPGQSKK